MDLLILLLIQAIPFIKSIAILTFIFGIVAIILFFVIVTKEERNRFNTVPRIFVKYMLIPIWLISLPLSAILPNNPYTFLALYYGIQIEGTKELPPKIIKFLNNYLDNLNQGDAN